MTEAGRWTSVQRATVVVAAAGTLMAIYFGIEQTKINRRLAGIAEDNVIVANKPVILRGRIQEWEEFEQYSYTHGPGGPASRIQGAPMQFVVHKNLARNVTGYIVVNHNRRRLLFGLAGSEPLVEKLGWVAPVSAAGDGILLAKPEEAATAVAGGNQVVIDYYDLTGRHYRTIESEGHNFEVIGPLAE